MKKLNKRSKGKPKSLESLASNNKESIHWSERVISSGTSTRSYTVSGDFFLPSTDQVIAGAQNKRIILSTEERNTVQLALIDHAQFVLPQISPRAWITAKTEHTASINVTAQPFNSRTPGFLRFPSNFNQMALGNLLSEFHRRGCDLGITQSLETGEFLAFSIFYNR